MPRQRDLVIGTAGHIDHGKTALVRALTGVDTDRLPAEKRGGSPSTWGSPRSTWGAAGWPWSTCPGTSGSSATCWPAPRGSTWPCWSSPPTTRSCPRPASIWRSSRSSASAGGVVVLTKCDLADPGWLALVEDDVRALVRGTFLESAEVVRTSSDDRPGDRRPQGRAWPGSARPSPIATTPGCSGWRSTDRSPWPGTARSSPGRSPRARSPSATTSNGSPEGRLVRVRGLHRHDRPVDRVAPGARAAINLVGVHHAEVAPRARAGLARLPGEPSRSSRSRSSPSAEAPRPLRHRGRYRIHLGTAEVSATLSLLERGAGPRRRGWPNCSWPSRSRRSTASRS